MSSSISGIISFNEMTAIVPAAKSSSSSNRQVDAKGFDGGLCSCPQPLEMSC